jgi:hypothetical protein
VQLKDATCATIMGSNFGIKSFYPKFWGHVLTPKFGSRRQGPQSLNSSRESQDIQQGLANQVAIEMKITSSFKGSGPYRQDQQGTEREDTSGSIEGKDWSPSYLKLGSFVHFSKFS